VEAAMKQKPPPQASGGRGDRQQAPDSGKSDDKRSDSGEDAGAQPSPSGEGDTGPREAQDKSDQGKPGNEGRDQRDPQPQWPPQPGDAEAQRKAAEQQRERRQQALAQQAGAGARDDDGHQGLGEPACEPSDAEREKQRANEAWLQRVPD